MRSVIFAHHLFGDVKRNFLFNVRTYVCGVCAFVTLKEAKALETHLLTSLNVGAASKTDNSEVGELALPGV